MNAHDYWQWALGIAGAILVALITGAVFLMRISFQMGKLVAHVDGKIEALEGTRDDHEKRLRVVEKTGRFRVGEAE